MLKCEVIYARTLNPITTRTEATIDDRFNLIHIVLHVGGVTDVGLRTIVPLTKTGLANSIVGSANERVKSIFVCFSDL